MGAQIQAKTSAVSDTIIKKARPFDCTKLLLKKRGQQLIMILIVLTPQRPSIPKNFVVSTYPSPLSRQKQLADEYSHDFSWALKSRQKQVQYRIPS